MNARYICVCVWFILITENNDCIEHTYLKDVIMIIIERVLQEQQQLKNTMLLLLLLLFAYIFRIQFLIITM